MRTERLMVVVIAAAVVALTFVGRPRGAAAGPVPVAASCCFCDCTARSVACVLAVGAEFNVSMASPEQTQCANFCQAAGCPVDGIDGCPQDLSTLPLCTVGVTPAPAMSLPILGGIALLLTAVAWMRVRRRA